MNKERFERLVTSAIETLPGELLERLENIAVVVEDYPNRAKLAQIGLDRGYTLLGLYEGVPLTERGTNYGLVTPDKITIFQKSIEAECGNDAEITAEIQSVVQHEIAHHFGIGDSKLRQIEKSKLKGKRKAS
ncbi:metallopeptidase family protein [Chloroflexota bacterium]